MSREKWQEIANRGLQDNFDPDTRARFDEAVRRGLITMPSQENNPVTKQAESDTFSISNMLMNTPGSVANQFGMLADAVMSPIDTAKGIGNMAVGGLYKANDLADKYTPDAMDFMFRPIGGGEKVFGKDQAPYAEAVGAHYADRYGSLDKILNTLESDPAGLAMDASGIVAPFSPKIATAINPISGSLKLANKARTAIPASVPRGLYERAAKFSTTLDKAAREKLVDTAVTNGLYPSTKGMDKLNSAASAISDKIDELVSISDGAGKTIPVNAIFKRLKKLRQDKGGVLMESGDDLAAIDKYAKQLKAAAEKSGKTRYTATDLQKIKRDLYKKIGWDAKRQKGSPIKEDTYKAIAHGAKDGVESLIPDAGGLNKHWGDLLELQPHLQRAANRIENRNMIPLSAPMNIGAGTAVGGPAGTAIGVVASILENPKISPRIALILEKMRNTGRLERFIMENQGLSQAEFLAVLEQQSREKAQ